MGAKCESSKFAIWRTKIGLHKGRLQKQLVAGFMSGVPKEENQRGQNKAQSGKPTLQILAETQLERQKKSISGFVK